MYNERKDTFSIKDIIVQVLCILLFIFLLLWLFPTKSYVKNNVSSNNGNVASGDQDIVFESPAQIVDAIFNFNVQTMKEAAISYYTTSRLPGKVGDSKKMTLREMLNEKLILSFLDSDNKQCDLDNSFVEITKVTDEYTLKVNLVCPASKSDYIIVHLGCYDYCKGNVCEKKTTTPTPSKEKTYSCKIVNGTYWGKNYTKVDKATYEKECTKEPVYYCKYVNGKYYGSTGKVVDKATYDKQCTKVPEPTPTPTPAPVTITCSVVGGVYYDNKGNVTTEANYNNVCNVVTPTPVTPTPVTPTPTPSVNITCSVVGDIYYDNKGNVTTEANYNNVCNTIIINPEPKTPEIKYSCVVVDGTYWGKNFNKVDKATYEKECLPKYSCAVVDGVYWGKNYIKVDKATYDKECTEPIPEKIYEYEYSRNVAGACTWSSWSSWSKTAVSKSSTVDVETDVRYEKTGTTTVTTPVVDTISPICSDSNYSLSSDGKTCSRTRKAIENLYCPNINGNQYTVYSATQCISSVANNDYLVKGTSGYYDTTKCTKDSEFTISSTLYDSVPSNTNTSETIYKLYRQVTDPACTTPNCNTKKYQVKVCTRPYISGKKTYCTNGYEYKNGSCYKLRDKKTEYVCAEEYDGTVGKYNKTTGLCEYSKASVCKKGYTKSADGSKCVKTTNDTKTEDVYSNVTYYRYRTLSCSQGTVEYAWSKSKNDATLMSRGYYLTGKQREVK